MNFWFLDLSRGLIFANQWHFLKLIQIKLIFVKINAPKVVNISDAFKNYNSLLCMKSANFRSKCKLNYLTVTDSEIKKEILNLTSTKVSKIPEKN